jgi:oligopeptide transport system ATP-binding protein
LDVYRGEIHGIAGESGSGKTTLARCSIHLLKPSSGSIRFGGVDLGELSAAALRAKRREFQMIFQDSFSSLNPAMTVKDILLEPLRIHKTGTRESQERRVRELLSAVSLEAALLRRRPAELSGGQQQRVGIARALMLKPELLIADEPVSSLDASAQAQILNLLADLHKHYELTLILISHSLPALFYLCTRISVMHFGRVVEQAPAARFFERPKHPYSQVLLKSGPAACETGIAAAYSPAGCSFYPHCPQAMEICGQQTPTATTIGPGESVACFLFG